MADENQMLQQLMQLMADLVRNQEGSGSGGSDSSSQTQPRVLELFKAAASGDTRRCRSIISGGVDVNSTDKKGFTALHLSAGKGEVGTAKALLDLGANLDAVDQDGDTPLIFAVLGNQEDMVQYLLDIGANLQHCNNRAMTAADIALRKQFLSVVFQLEGFAYCLQYDCDLHCETLQVAAQEGNLDVVEFWLQNHPDKKVCDHRIGDDRTLAFIAALNGHNNILLLLDSVGADFEIADNRCHTPLFCAAQNNHLEAATFLIKNKKCNVNHLSVTQRTPMFSAVSNGHSEMVQLLLNNGADVNADDDDGITALELAIKGDYYEIFRILLDAGADLKHFNDNGFDYAIIAAHSNNLEILQELKMRGLAVTNVNPKSQSTALLAASQVGNEEMVKFLLDCGSNHSHRNKHGVSPALRAAYNGNAGVLRVLGEAGAQLDLPNKTNETAVLCAAQNDSLEMVSYLHSKRCSMAVKDHDGKTLAWYAAKKGNAELLAFLRDAQAPLDVQDGDGNSPLMMAVKEKVSEQAIQLLVEAGCSIKRQNKEGESPESIAKRIGHGRLLTALGLEDRRQLDLEVADSPASRQSSGGDEGSHLDPNFERWEIIYDDEKKRPIGEGGFGKVYKALTDRHQFVAVKIVKSYGIDRSRFEHAVESERKGMEILRQVRHPNIMTFLRCESKSNEAFYIFTELIAGTSLSDLMRLQKRGFDEYGIRKFSSQICTALNHLHTRKPMVLHRDIKCSNIMLTHVGQVKLIDFGLAKEVVSASEIYTSFTQCGTVCYMAPELLEEDYEIHASYSPKSDVWAFGCTVYEMCTTQPPLSTLRQTKIVRAILDDPMPNLPASLSHQLHQFYQRCVIKDPNQRPSTMQLMEEAFIRGS